MLRPLAAPPSVAFTNQIQTSWMCYNILCIYSCYYLYNFSIIKLSNIIITINCSFRVTYVKIHGIKYCSQAVVRVKKSTPDNYEPFIYCHIKNIYVYQDAKIFELEEIDIVYYNENIRAIKVKTTGQTLWCLYNDLYYHGPLHLKRKGENIYIVDKQFWTYHF